MDQFKQGQFKQGMRRLAGAVTVVTTGVGDEVAGLTATAVCSLTAEPPRLLACLNTHGESFELLRRYKRFCVNVIGGEDLWIAETFAGMRASAVDGKFAAGQWQTGADISPRLESALVSFQCSVHSLTLLSTHCLAIGDVLEVHIGSPESGALLYHDGQFAQLAALTHA
jgi:flavin reductase (DIM6/NTAB) family NADH-FMN oxidoreductase RutF